MRDRYFIDRRGGCIAVRDREHTDPDYQGLGPDTEGVVGYWSGTHVSDKCPTCGHERGFGWTLSREAVNEAYALCAKLNGKDA